MNRLKLTFSSPAYDRNDSLLTGEVQPDGIELSYVTMPPQEAHYRMLKNQEFDVSEMSISHYIIAKLAGKAPFTAIPVFPMRRFFHVDLVVNKQQGIENPSDLKGKKIGVPEYSMSFALWLRGILQHEFSVAPSDMKWYLERAPKDRVGESFGFVPPADVSIRGVPEGENLMTMLEKGELDAAMPQFSFWKNERDRSSLGGDEPPQNVRFLFENQKAESIRYYRKTGIFPVNHTVVIKDQLLKQHPWIAKSLYDAFVESKERSYQRMRTRMREATNYVFLDDLVREVQTVFGNDPYPYGIRKNKRVLDAVTTYSYEQGLSHSRASLEDLFFTTMLDS